MVEVITISKADAGKILELEESHFVDLKAKEVAPGSLTEFVSAFANADGGELYIGIAETKQGNSKSRKWVGFQDIEAANGHMQAVEEMLPLGGHYRPSFFRTKGMAGLILHIDVPKSRDILKASDGFAYIRKGARKFRVKDGEPLRRLRLDKGIVSFEDDTVPVELSVVSKSTILRRFLETAVPSASPEDWIKKQNLMVGDKPTVAATLLFHDEPQAALPKRSAVKIYRYKTKDAEGTRETLAGNPITVEGPLYDLIFAAVAETKKIIEGMKILTDRGLEQVIYPEETLHEIITNAVLHRDYSILSDVHVRIFDNRVEVQSPGKFPGHITAENILTEQVARNPKIVRLINKFDNPPNKDVGEGLNTAFKAMKAMKLKEPEILEVGEAVVVYIRHSPLASPEETIMDYLGNHDEVTNRIARELTGIGSENAIKQIFYKLRNAKQVERVPGKKGTNAAWRKWTGTSEEG